MIRRIISAMVVIMMVMVMFLGSVYAKVDETSDNEAGIKLIEARFKNYSIGIVEENEYGIRAEEVCEGYDYHDMVSRGWGYVYRGTYPDVSDCVIEAGSCWQCSRCQTVLITEFNPLEDNYVGDYAFWSPGYVINANGASIWTNTIYYTSDNNVPHCILRYN